MTTKDDLLGERPGRRRPVAKIVLGVAVLAAIAWVVFENRRESARIDELASLPPCRLAAEYMRWRLDFEEAHAAAADVESVPESFIARSEMFEEAARRAQRDSPSPLLEALESVTMIDSARWVRREGDIDAFVEVMLAECPDEVRELLGGGEQ